MSVQLGQCLTISPEVVSAPLEQAAILLDLRSKYFYRVNRTGWAILQVLEDGATREALTNCCKGWGAEDESEIDSFVDALIDYSILQAGEAYSKNSDVKFDGSWVKPEVERQPEPLQKVIISAFDPSIPLAE